MPSISFASFLAGSLLSLLMPVLLLIGLVVWYVVAIRRVPGGGTSERSDRNPAAGVADPSVGVADGPAGAADPTGGVAEAQASGPGAGG
jgi:hypothetical protein